MTTKLGRRLYRLLLGAAESLDAFLESFETCSIELDPIEIQANVRAAMERLQMALDLIADERRKTCR